MVGAHSTGNGKVPVIIATRIAASSGVRGGSAQQKKALPETPRYNTPKRLVLDNCWGQQNKDNGRI